MAVIDLVAAPDETHRAAIACPLGRFNDSQLGPIQTVDLPFALVVRDGKDGPITGGAWGRSYYQWLFIELLVVPEALRGQGIGSELLRKAEAEARQRACHGVWLDTFSFQARGFYEKHGYAVFGEIADYPAPHSRFFLSKRLV